MKHNCADVKPFRSIWVGFLSEDGRQRPEGDTIAGLVAHFTCRSTAGDC